MEMPVGSSTSLSTGLDTLFDIVCQPCSSEGRNAEAEGYCQDCCEHLCAQCYICHKNYSMSKHHKLLDKHNMPNIQEPPTVKDVCTERCHTHDEEVIKYYCHSHKVLCCTVCQTLNHTFCKDVEYIPEVVTGLEDSQDYKEFKVNLDDLIQKSKDTADFSHGSKQRSSDCLSKAIHDIEAFRQKIIDTVDTKLNELKDYARQIHAQDTYTMNALADENNQVQTELQSILSDLNTLLDDKQYCQMFIEMKRKQEYITELEEKLKDMEGAEVSEYKYEHDDDFRSSLERESCLGKLVMNKTGKLLSTAKGTTQNNADTSKLGTAAKHGQHIKATHTADINAQSDMNMYNCNISGLTSLTTERLIVSDNANCKLKLIDTTTKKTVSELKLKTSPWDVTLCGDTIAATLPIAKKIMFMKHDNVLVYERDIHVGGRCMGIDSSDDKLFVIFDKEKKLEIMTMTGVVIHRFKTNEQGERLFEQPAYVTVSKMNEAIYVSEWGKGQIKMLDMDGMLNVVHESSALGRPKQLVVDKAGIMYICDNRNNTIQLLSPRSTHMNTILTRRDGLTRPLSVCYCENTGRLYVGMYNSDVIKIYQVS